MALPSDLDPVRNYDSIGKKTKKNPLKTTKTCRYRQVPSLLRCALRSAATSDGSIDITVKTEDYIYVIELKYDGTSEKALKQIEDKKYDRKFQMKGREIIRIGVNFSSETRCIEGWQIE